MNRPALERVGEILSRAAGVRVLVVGDLMLDRYITGRVERISPEAPVPVVRVEGESTAVGGAANVAANVAALGASCQVVGTAGNDVYGGLLEAELEALGVGTGGLLVTGERPTTVKTRVLARHQQVVRYDHEEDGDVSPELAGALVEAVVELARACDAVVLEDYDKGVLVPPVIRAALDAAAARGIPTVVDPKRLRFFDYAGAFLFKPNAKELREALGTAVNADDPDWLGRIRERLDCEALLVTLGDEGMALTTRVGDYLRISAAAREVYDVSGAGDTVTAVCAVALAAGASPAEAAILANHAAALEVAKAGVATVTAAEILERYETQAGAGPAGPVPRELAPVERRG